MRKGAGELRTPSIVAGRMGMYTGCHANGNSREDRASAAADSRAYCEDTNSTLCSCTKAANSCSAPATPKMSNKSRTVPAGHSSRTRESSPGEQSSWKHGPQDTSENRTRCSSNGSRTPSSRCATVGTNSGDRALHSTCSSSKHCPNRENVFGCLDTKQNATGKYAMPLTVVELDADDERVAAADATPDAGPSTCAA